jgi:hypothetical protein
MKPVFLVFVAPFILALGACRGTTAEDVASACEMKAETALAASALSGWEREKAKGAYANVCMRASGYARNEEPLRSLCMQNGPQGAGDFYWRMDADCWKRTR